MQIRHQDTEGRQVELLADAGRATLTIAVYTSSFTGNLLISRLMLTRADCRNCARGWGRSIPGIAKADNGGVAFRGQLVTRNPIRSFASPAGDEAFTSIMYSPEARPASGRSI